MCDTMHEKTDLRRRAIPVADAVGTVLAHDITEIRPGEFKGPAFRKGHIIREEDVCHLQRLGKEHLFVLHVPEDEMHEDDAALALAGALMGEGVRIKGEPREGKINIVAERDGLLKIDKDALLAFNMLGDVMCATQHNNAVVKEGRTVAGTRAIPLTVKKRVVEEAVRICKEASTPDTPDRGIIQVKEMRKPRVGVVITGNEVFHGRVQDAFSPIIKNKIEAIGGEITGIRFAPDDTALIEERLRELLDAGSDLLVTTGGMSVDPDDVTRFAIGKLGATDLSYGSAVLPGAMFLVAYVKKVQGSRFEVQSQAKTPQENNIEHGTVNLEHIPVLGIPACGMYAKTTIFDLILPRVLAGEKIGRKELAELGHGGLCMKCEPCRYPVCPFGK